MFIIIWDIDHISVVIWHERNHELLYEKSYDWKHKDLG